MALSLTTIVRLEPPYKNKCTKSYPDHIVSHVPENTNYLDITCWRTCLNLYIHKQCNCTDPLLLDAQAITKTKLKSNMFESNFCDVQSNHPDRICVNTADYSNYDSTCNCQSDCHTSQYKVIYF